jgi:hypothetical protein
LPQSDEGWGFSYKEPTTTWWIIYTPIERFEILKKFWGYGDPKTARIVLVGVEEGGNWSEKSIAKSSMERKQRNEADEYEKIIDDMLTIFKKQYCSMNDWDIVYPDWKIFFRATNRKQVKLSMMLRNSLFEGSYDFDDQKQQREYYESEFCTHIEFQANIFPIPNKSIKDWDIKIAKLLGVSENKSDYCATCLDDRLTVQVELLHELKRNNGEPYIFLMGKRDIWTADRWSKIRSKLFPDMKFSFDNGDAEESRYGWSHDKKVWLAVHPSGRDGLRIEEMKQIVKQIELV